MTVGCFQKQVSCEARCFVPETEWAECAEELCNSKLFDTHAFSEGLSRQSSPADIRTHPLQIRFLGGKLGKALAEAYDVSTVGDLLWVHVQSSDSLSL